MVSQYYTIDKPRAVCNTSSGVSGWKLSINYHKRPKHNRKVMRADSNVSKFRIHDAPPMFDTKEAALAMGTKFHILVKNVVHGNQTSRTGTTILMLI